MNSLRNYLKTREAASMLGVAPNTLRAWANAGKVKMHRNPVNNYRLFLRDDLEMLLRQIDSSGSPSNSQKRQRPR